MSQLGGNSYLRRRAAFEEHFVDFPFPHREARDETGEQYVFGIPIIRCGTPSPLAGMLLDGLVEGAMQVDREKGRAHQLEAADEAPTFVKNSLIIWGVIHHKRTIAEEIVPGELDGWCTAINFRDRINFPEAQVLLRPDFVSVLPRHEAYMKHLDDG